MEIRERIYETALSTAIRNYDDVLQREPDGKLVQAASPLDVRKVSDFPHGVFLGRGCAPKRGAQPQNL